MIGPRHMMTASHVVVWKPNNTAGWIKFTPLKFDSSEPFGHAFATLIYSWNKADGSDGLNLTEGAFDYVVCVLDSPLGNVTGWMGSRGYDTAWDNGNYWGYIGYPSDLSGGSRPAFIGWQDFLGEQSASLGGRSSYRIRHEIDVIPGQSGGPYFGVWAGEPWPRVVGIQSGQNLGGSGGDNTSGGGNPLSELINFARNAMP
jgi:V8-like Glu-specific endopeptidase